MCEASCLDSLVLCARCNLVFASFRCRTAARAGCPNRDPRGNCPGSKWEGYPECDRRAKKPSERIVRNGTTDLEGRFSLDEGPPGSAAGRFLHATCGFARWVARSKDKPSRVLVGVAIVIC